MYLTKQHKIASTFLCLSKYYSKPCEKSVEWPPSSPKFCKPLPMGPAPKMKQLLNKPIMKRLHWTQTKSVLARALVLACLAGWCVFRYIGLTRIAAYRYMSDYVDTDPWIDEMADKGYFTSFRRPPCRKEDNKCILYSKP